MRTRVVPFIISLNVIVFILWKLSLWRYTEPQFMVQHFLVSWDALLEGRIWTLLSSVFSHESLIHLLVNMFVLSSFGRIMELAMGHMRFLRFYLVAGIFSSLAHALVSAYFIGDSSIPALGASGAIAGVVLLFAMMFPDQKILLFGLIPLPAIWGALAFMGLDIWGLFAQAGGGGLPIGHGAHLGGALTGIVYYLFFIRPRMSPRHGSRTSDFA